MENALGPFLGPLLAVSLHALTRRRSVPTSIQERYHLDYAIDLSMEDQGTAWTKLRVDRLVDIVRTYAETLEETVHRHYPANAHSTLRTEMRRDQYMRMASCLVWIHTKGCLVGGIEEYTNIGEMFFQRNLVGEDLEHHLRLIRTVTPRNVALGRLFLVDVDYAIQELMFQIDRLNRMGLHYIREIEPLMDLHFE